MSAAQNGRLDIDRQVATVATWLRGDEMKNGRASTATVVSPAELRLAAVALERRLSEQVRAFEARYELGSADLEQAVRSGVIRETAEVADWVIAYRTLLGLADELQARPE
jgi:sirohydrochlorin ferrochelatase